MKSPRTKPTRFARRRRGQALVEFAMISLVMYLLLAAMLEYGRAIFAAQTLQAAADLAAREIARTPLPPNTTLKAALQSDAVRRIYNEEYLVINTPNRSFDDLPADLPIVNQQLLPLMFFDKLNGDDVLRYPGAIVSKGASRYTVKVPYVQSRDRDGIETIKWHDVIESIIEIPADDETSDPFHIASDERGVVTLRINYPFQAASMSSYPSSGGDGFPNAADDSAVIVANPDVLEGDLVAPDVAQPDQHGPRYGSASGDTAYSGSYGLGVHGAMGQQVRPFRKVISAQAVYRREVFGS